LTIRAKHRDRLIIPIILEHVNNLPHELEIRQWLNLSGRHEETDVVFASREMVNAVKNQLKIKTASLPIPLSEVPQMAATIATQARDIKPSRAKMGQLPNSAFLVHGHDKTALSEMETYLAELGVKSFVLSRVGGPAQSLLQKFLKSAADSQFAIVILSADDLGALRIQYDAKGVGDRALQFRARQNVILELGFFYGLLGWENVFVLYRPPKDIFPNFERPSDIEGAVFDSMDELGEWRNSLTQKLIEAGFRINKR
jgi:predicted nucleotide-binding protein